MNGKPTSAFVLYITINKALVRSQIFFNRSNADAAAKEFSDQEHTNYHVWVQEVPLSDPIPIPYYVCKAWEDFPETGTCAEILWATSDEEAEEMMIDTMVDYRFDLWDDSLFTTEERQQAWEEFKKTYQDSWHTIDCYPLIQGAVNMLSSVSSSPS